MKMKDGCDFVSLNKVLVPLWLLTPFLNWFGRWLFSRLSFVHHPFSLDCQLLSSVLPGFSVSLPLSDST